MKKKTKVLLIAAACLVVVGGGATFALSRAATSAADTNAAVTSASAVLDEVSVSAMKPDSGDLTVSTEFIGRVQPDEVVNVLPKAAGTVLATHYNIGDTVKKGDLLFEIDPVDIQAQVAMAQAGYDVAVLAARRAVGSALDLQLAQVDSAVRTSQNAFSSANKAFNDYIDDYDPSLEKLEETRDDLYDSLKEAKEGNKYAQDAYEKAKAAYEDTLTIGASYTNEQKQYLYEAFTKARENANKTSSAVSTLQATYEQMKEAYNQKKDGYDVQFDQLKSAMKSANIALDSASKTEDITINQAVPEAEASSDAAIAQAKASLAASMLQLEYTKVYAPIDGTIEQKLVEEHGPTGQSSPAYVISNKEIMVVKFSVPASAAQVMAVGDTLDIEIGSAHYTGSVIEIGTMADAQSGLFPVKARVDAESGTLLSGVSVKVTAQTQKTESALLVPVDSIYHEDDKSYLYIVSSDGTAKKTYVETGITDDNMIEITSGIDADTQVVTSWNPNLLDGAKLALTGEEDGGSAVSSAADASSTQADASSIEADASSSQEE